MRRLLVILILALCAFGAWFVFVGADGGARKEAQRQLAAFGFKEAQIASVNVSARRTELGDVALERTGIDRVESITLSQGWLSRITGGGTADILIRAPDIYRTFDHINDLLPGLMMLNRDTLAAIPEGRIIVQDGRASIASPLGLFQFLYDIVIEPADEDGRRIVHATLKSHERTLDLDGTWRGWIAGDGAILLDAFIPEIKAQIGPVRLTRGNGWFSLASAGKYPALSGQVESGAAGLGELPLQNFFLTVDAARDAFTVLMRAQPSGTTQTRLSADIALDETQKQIALTLTSTDIPAFMHYLDTALERPAGELAKAFAKDKTLDLALEYQLTKRFPGGPYPFDMRGLTQAGEFLSGTFLVYPGTYDMRGSAKIDPAYMQEIARYFKLPEETRSGDYIRLDASLAPFVSGVGAGIENDAGE